MVQSTTAQRDIILETEMKVASESSTGSAMTMPFITSLDGFDTSEHLQEHVKVQRVPK